MHAPPQIFENLSPQIGYFQHFETNLVLVLYYFFARKLRLIQKNKGEEPPPYLDPPLGKIWKI